MKKIQVSTVRQTADVEVLFINAALISKVIRASIAINNVIDKAKVTGCIVPRYNTVVDDEGAPETDERGVIKTAPALNDKGEQIIDYCSTNIDSYDLASLNEDVASLLTELVEAFEG